MPRNAFSSVTDQAADRLRQGMIEGRWSKTLPGRDRLARELGCSHCTVEQAMQRLSKEGLLVSQGPGKRRRIELPQGGAVQSRSLRVRVLLYEKSDRQTDYLVELIHRLQEAGHEASFAEKTLLELGMNADRVARFATSTEADAWVVVAGPQDVLQWFAEQETPAFALFGRLKQVALPSTSPKKADAYIEVVDRLVEWGHRRIVYLVRQDRRKPTPGYLENVFLERLEYHGIETGPYHLPDWEESPEGLRDLLVSLFKHTPPTAILLGEPSTFAATREQLARLGILAPEQVSLVCSDAHPIFNWSLPPVTHIAWDSQPIIQRVVKWASNISRGKDDRRKSSHKAELVMGGTIGPVPSSSK